MECLANLPKKNSLAQLNDSPTDRIWQPVIGSLDWPHTAADHVTFLEISNPIDLVNSNPTEQNNSRKLPQEFSSFSFTFFELLIIFDFIVRID